MGFDDSDKAFLKLTIMEGFEAHREHDHKPLEAKVEKLSLKISYWAGGIAVIIAALGLLLGTSRPSHPPLIPGTTTIHRGNP